MSAATVVQMPGTKRKLPKKDVIRAGDFVRVVVPKVVTRVGYPKSVQDYLADVRGAHAPALTAFLQQLLGSKLKRRGLLGLPGEVQPYLRKKVEHELAYLLAKLDGFGGRERSLHMRDAPELGGEVMRVVSVRSVMTGTYYAPSGTSPSMFDEGDYEPGGLMNQTRHRLASVVDPTVFAPVSGKHSGMVELPLAHLVKVPKENP